MRETASTQERLNEVNGSCCAAQRDGVLIRSFNFQGQASDIMLTSVASENGLISPGSEKGLRPKDRHYGRYPDHRGGRPGWCFSFRDHRRAAKHAAHRGEIYTTEKAVAVISGCRTEREFHAPAHSPDTASPRTWRTLTLAPLNHTAFNPTFPSNASVGGVVEYDTNVNLFGLSAIAVECPVVAFEQINEGVPPGNSDCHSFLNWQPNRSAASRSDRPAGRLLPMSKGRTLSMRQIETGDTQESTRARDWRIILSFWPWT